MRLERASTVAVPRLVHAGGTRTRHGRSTRELRRIHMNGIIYLVGLVVVIMFILSFLGLR
jgi:hypothetical protein